ncbi:MAG: phage holin family protein, partial [Pseudomonadota bacterium]
MTDPDRPSADRLAATRSIPELVSKLIGDVTTLVAKEGDLIRSEINDKIVQLQAGVGKIAAGGILLLVALLVVANALVDALAGLLGTVDPSHGKTGWAA